MNMQVLFFPILPKDYQFLRYQVITFGQIVLFSKKNINLLISQGIREIKAKQKKY
jgi:hypothetical protein